MKQILEVVFGIVFVISLNSQALPSQALSKTIESNTSYNVYWGDIHCHTCYSDCPAAANDTIPPYGALLYARDSSLLDFVAITDHAEDLTDSEWADIRNQNALFYDPGVFVTFNAWEFTASGLINGGGHKNVYFADDSLPSLPIGCGDALNAPALWDSLAGYNCITIPHHPAKGNNGHFWPSSMATDWDYVNAQMQPIVEIYQSQGNSEIDGCEEPVNDFQPLKSVEAALKRWLNTHNPGYKLGIICSTDDHTSKPGSVGENPSFVDTAEGYSSGGLIAVLATEKTREAIFEALRSKRVYGTSGPRIRLNFMAITNLDTFTMGETINCTDSASITFMATAVGDGAGIDSIWLIKNGELLSSQANDTLIVSDVARNWCYYRVKVFQVPTRRWDGVMFPERAWSSPIWVETGFEGVTENEDNLDNIDFKMSCYPNPFYSRAEINFFLSRQEYVKLDMYDILGRRIKTLTQGYFSPGEHTLTLNSQDLAVGTYFVRLQTENANLTKKVIYLK
jgi:hypothetical protein